jgi:hypothetical protein
MPPIITSFNPLSSFPGGKVTISGSGFARATAVKFGGYDALTFRVVSDTTIEAYTGVDGDGVVSVTGPGGTGSIAGFTQQKIKKKIPDFPPLGRTPVAGDKVLVWADAEGKTTYADVADLPFGDGGGGPGAGGTITYQSGLWKVRIYSSGFIYDAASGNSVISDIRLLGIDDGVVTSTQVGCEFSEEQLEFDPEAGTVTLLNFELSPNEHITININGAANYAYNNALQGALATLADQAMISAPFKPTVTGPNGAKVMWMRPANEIPPGWQECEDMRGLLPMAQDPKDDDLNGLVGVATGGSKSKKLSMANIPEITLQQGGEGPNNEFGGGVLIGKRNWGYYNSGLDVYKQQNTSSAGKADPDAINLLNPYRIVMWIEYVGLG